MTAARDKSNQPKAVDPTKSALAQGVADDPMADALAEQQAAVEAMIAEDEAAPPVAIDDPEPEAADLSAIVSDIVSTTPEPPSPNQKRRERAATGTKATGTTATAREVAGALARAVQSATEVVPTQGERPMSIRRQRRMRAQDVSTLAQLRQFGRPEGDLTGTATYWVRPGATIRDALIINPNGGIPNIDDLQLAAKYGTNANYYRDRALKKGFIFIGPTLTAQGIRILIEVMEAEKPDELLYLEEEIEIAQRNADEAGAGDKRSNELNRVRQLKRRFELVSKPIDAEGLTRDLDRIRRAQELQKLTPSMRQAISALFSQVLEELGPVAAALADGRGAATHPIELQGVAYGRAGVTAPDEGMVRGAARESLTF